MKFNVQISTHPINLRIDLNVLKLIDTRKCFLNSLITFNNVKGKSITRGDIIEEMTNTGVCGLEIIDIVGSKQYNIKKTTETNELFTNKMLLFFQNFECKNHISWSKEYGEIFAYDLTSIEEMGDFIQKKLQLQFLKTLDISSFEVYSNDFLKVLFDSFYLEVLNNSVVFTELNKSLVNLIDKLKEMIYDYIKNIGIDV